MDTYNLPIDNLPLDRALLQQIVWTTTSNSTTSTTNNYNYTINYNYNRYVTNNTIMDDIYDFKFRYSDTISGLTNYIYANDLVTEIIHIMENFYYEFENPQDFEDDIYYIALDLLYTLVNQNKEEQSFESMLSDENKYPSLELDRIIKRIIKNFHSLLILSDKESY